MKAVINFLWLLIRCMAFLWAVITVIILILFVIGTEGEGYSWAERIVIAIRYAGYVAAIFGTLLALQIWWKNWRIERSNRKKSERRDMT